MSAITKKKLCWNCEGRVSQQEENCSYCGVYLNGTLHNQGQKQDTDHLFSKKGKGKGKEQHLPPYTPEEEEPIAIPENKDKPKTEEAPISLKMPIPNLNKEFVALLFLLSGSLFLLFSFVLLLFSNNGVFILKWDADFWFIYLALSLPLLFFGWRYLSNLPSNDAG